MEKHMNLTPEQERLVEDFAFDLAMIDGPDDMFPPDGGVREPREPLLPSSINDATVALAAVYDLTRYRHNRGRSNSMIAASVLV